MIHNLPDLVVHRPNQTVLNLHDQVEEDVLDGVLILGPLDLVERDQKSREDHHRQRDHLERDHLNRDNREGADN